MRNRMRILVAVLIASAAGPALAQGIPVFDATSYVQSIQQVINSGQQLTQGVTQIQQTLSILKQAQQSYNSFAKLTNASSIAAVLNDPTIRNILPPEIAGVGPLLSGNPANLGAIGTIATQYQQKYKLSDTAADGSNYGAGVNAAYANYLTSLNGGAAVQAALGDNLYNQMNYRTQGLTQLKDSISTAQDPKDVMDIQARIQVEGVQATTDMIKMQAIQLGQQAQNDLLLKQYWVSRSRTANIALKTALTPSGN